MDVGTCLFSTGGWSLLLHPVVWSVRCVIQVIDGWRLTAVETRCQGLCLVQEEVDACQTWRLWDCTWTFLDSRSWIEATTSVTAAGKASLLREMPIDLANFLFFSFTHSLGCWRRWWSAGLESEGGRTKEEINGRTRSLTVQTQQPVFSTKLLGPLGDPSMCLSRG